MRIDGRTPSVLRPMSCTPDVNCHAEGSAIFEMGLTRVLCTATVTNDLPRWRRDTGLGWVTAEYRMLPRATGTRGFREGRSDLKGRTAEIQRLVARSLRAAVDLKALGRRQVIVDCDVLQADGGTRAASVNGGWVALTRALQTMVQAGVLETMPIKRGIAAVSVGIVDGRPMLDLAYDEDARAEVDLNVVMTGDGRLVEVQGTAEGEPFHREQMTEMMDLASCGIEDILAFQRRWLTGG